VPCLEYPRRMTDFFEEAMGGEGSDQ